MSVPNKSLDKNKRYAGVKANDFVNKTRANEANRSAVRPQGWANLGKINSRRVPPPANLPSLKSETGVNTPVFDPTTTTNHGWTSNDNQSSNNSTPNPTQQQLDSLPVNSPTPPSSADIDKARTPSTWSAVTAGTTEQPPNLLGLNDFPRLATTTQDRKSQPETIQNPTFRPANIAIWKEGGGTRIQPISNDFSQVIPNNPGANVYQQQMPNPNMRMYPQQMWAYNPYTPVPLPMHQQQHLNEYKSPTILRNKDIDDLSKITDNTWANASQEVNYEEKIRFSDDDENEILDSNIKPRRIHPQVLQHSRLIQDDKHLKKMQDNKNSELINTLTIAKQRRDEQERHLRNEQQNFDEQKPIPGYQTRPLLASNDQENINWKTTKDTSRNHHDTKNSQSSFAMKSWSDQMDSFNYSSLHEKSGGHEENDDTSALKHYSRSHSESSSHSQHKKETISRKTKKLPLSSKKQPKQRLIQTKNLSKKSTNNNDQWNNWDESTDAPNNNNNNRHQQYTNDNNNNNRRRQQLHSDDLSIQKPNRFNKQSVNKTHDNDRQQNSRSKPLLTNKDNKSNNKNQPAWRPLSPTRPTDIIDPTPQESTSYKSKQRYQTTNSTIINTASIPPLMSVRSDVTATGQLYKTGSTLYDDNYYDDENAYYDSNLQTHQRYQHSNLHNRGYTALGSYGRYRRGGTHRQQQQYATYHMNNTSGISSAPSTTTGTRQKKNSINRTNTNNKKSTEQPPKTPIFDETKSSSLKIQTPTEDISITKPIETSITSPITEISTPDIGKSNDTSEQKSSIKTDNESNIVGQTENESTKTNKKNPTTPSSNAKRRTNKDQKNYYQTQQAPRHRNNYSRAMQEYDPMQMASTHNYYGTNRRTTHNIHMHDLSTGYYYEHPQQHYNNRYNYSNEHYQQQQYSINKNSKRGGSSKVNNRQQKQPIINGNNNTNNNNYRHHSTSDNDQKEGEEWETASESSTNMRNGHYDNNQQINETKSINRGRTPPKKSFSSQRPNARQILKYTNA